jgi:hypothetical protein
MQMDCNGALQSKTPYASDSGVGGVESLKLASENGLASRVRPLSLLVLLWARLTGRSSGDVLRVMIGERPPAQIMQQSVNRF